MRLLFFFFNSRVCSLEFVCGLLADLQREARGSIELTRFLNVTFFQRMLVIHTEKNEKKSQLLFCFLLLQNFMKRLNLSGSLNTHTTHPLSVCICVPFSILSLFVVDFFK